MTKEYIEEQIEKGGQFYYHDIRENVTHLADEHHLEGWTIIHYDRNREPFDSNQYEDMSLLLSAMQDIADYSCWKERKENWTVEKKDELEKWFIDYVAEIGLGVPDNYEDIVQNIYEYVCGHVSVDNYRKSDMITGFRKWIESH